MKMIFLSGQNEERRYANSSFAFLGLIWVFAPVLAGDEFSIDWYTIDGGGELSSSGGEWALSATIGQWDATGPRQSKRGQWSLTGGFWGFTLEELADLLFEDRFEEQEEAK